MKIVSTMRSYKTAWILLLVIVAVAVVLLITAPSEATIGTGIHIVYVHVAFTWTGLLGLLITGFFGLVILVTNSQPLHSWMVIVGWVSLVMFALGVGTSLIAEQVNWGGIAWREPRTYANLNLLALATVIIISGNLIGWPRLQGALNLILAAVLLWTTFTTELQLHPAGAISSSTSGAIRITFYGLFAMCVLAAGWLVWFFHGQQTAKRASS